MAPTNIHRLRGGPGLLIVAIALGSEAFWPRAGATEGGLESGLIYWAYYSYETNPLPISNPYISGALFWLPWSMVEVEDNVYDWSVIDSYIAPWIAAGKKAALRIMWSGSGTWSSSYARHPTPQFVWDAGAVMAYSESTHTEVPLQWDPIYKQYALRFMEAVADKYDKHPGILFIDTTPGGETNPFRGNLATADPNFADVFAATPASNGVTYSDALWVQTVKEYIDAANECFGHTMLLTTLNRGKLPGDSGPEHFVEFGDHSVSRGFLVGQNGLNKDSYLTDSTRKQAFLSWNDVTRLYFEMGAPTSDPGTGTLMEVMQAASRIECNYLGVSAPDVLKGTAGYADYDPAYEQSLAYGASVVRNFAFNPSQVWVEFGYEGLELGGEAQPYDTIQDALIEVASQGVVKIKSGSSAEAPRIDQAVKLEAVGGNVRIGSAALPDSGGTAQSITTIHDWRRMD